MKTLTLQTPHALMLYSTRGGQATSDSDGVVTGVAPGSQMLTDLLAQGAYVIPAPMAGDSVDSNAEPLGDPVE